MFELKVDPKNPHHYIIGVAIKDMHSKNRGQMYVKYGPLYFTNDDVQNVANAKTLLDDKIYRDIYKMKPGEIYVTTECNEIIMTLIGIKIAARANNATLHHFSSSYELPNAEKFFDDYVERANIVNSKEMKGLDSARIKGY
jgi:hypothetical protein